MRMKDVREMTMEEITAEMRSYDCRKDRGYAFISYSHRDREQIYPLVLTWMRAGYNLYIDLDFERHGSDSNWADLMLDTLSSRLCRLAICFKSAHYRYSYAALLELLTMRGETVTNRHSGKLLPVDSVVLGMVPDDDEIPENCQELYAAAFRSMQSGMGERFLGQNRKEAALLGEGLHFWLEESRTKAVLRKAPPAEKMAGYLQDAYRAGYQDFFPQIAFLVKNWFISQDLNGNDYSLNSSLPIRLARFDEVRVERVRESLLPAFQTVAAPSAGAGGFAGSQPPAPASKPAASVPASPTGICHWEDGGWKPIAAEFVRLSSFPKQTAPCQEIAGRPAGDPVPEASDPFDVFRDSQQEREQELLEKAPWAAMQEAARQRAEMERREQQSRAPRPLPHLVRVSTGEIIQLHEGTFKLGRSITCDYQIAGNSAVGRVHAVLLVRGGRASIVDQHSKNYTLLNGRAIHPDKEYPLTEGDAIRISSETFLFHE